MQYLFIFIIYFISTMSVPIEVTSTGLMGIDLNQHLDVNALANFKKDLKRSGTYSLWFDDEYDYYKKSDSEMNLFIAIDKKSSIIKGIFCIASSDELFSDAYLIGKLGNDYSILESSRSGNNVRSSLGWHSKNILIKKTKHINSGQYKLEYMVNDKYMPGITIIGMIQ